MSKTERIEETMNQITSIDYRGIEAVALENEQLKVVILPELGGKTASVIDKGTAFELAAQPDRHHYKLPGRNEPFDQYDASGLDDTFPTIIKSRFEWKGKCYDYPDHGEIWSARFDQHVNHGKLELSYLSKENHYRYEKTVSLKGYSVIYKYHIKNTGKEELPCIWTMHGLVRYEEDMELLYPKEIESFINVAESKELGSPGKVYPAAGNVYDFRHVPPRSAKTELKYYAVEAVKRGKCGYYYPTQKICCEISYDAELFPYLGMWITAGGYRGDYNCAWEPSNGFYDGIEIAQENGALVVMKPEESLNFVMEIHLYPFSSSR